MTHLLNGQRAEQMALQFLKRQGLKLITKNYPCYFGEIDLIMSDQSTLVFVEVRFRSNQRYGSAIESITSAKIRRITKTAWHYLAKHKQMQQRTTRFDVIGIEFDFKINWIKNAFEVQY